jgi:hypothetical protein
MKTFGATVFMIGLGQFMFQLFLQLTGGYWSRFTVGDFLAEFGIYAGYGYNLWDRTWQAAFRAEFSLVLMAIGVVLVLAVPAWRIYQAWHAERLILAANTRPSYLQQRRAR